MELVNLGKAYEFKFLLPLPPNIELTAALHLANFEKRLADATFLLLIVKEFIITRLYWDYR
jgi:hypothetical protein